MAEPLEYRRVDPNKIRVLTPEEQWWRLGRISFRVGLFVLIFPIALYFISNYLKFGKFTRLTAADYVPKVQQFGVPMVRAIKLYQKDTGQLPLRVEDLEPKYMKPHTSRNYDGQMYGNGTYWMFGGRDESIIYDFKSGQEGWSVSGPYVNGRIPLPIVTIGPASQPSLQSK